MNGKHSGLLQQKYSLHTDDGCSMTCIFWKPDYAVVAQGLSVPMLSHASPLTGLGLYSVIPCLHAHMLECIVTKGQLMCTRDMFMANYDSRK